MRGLNDQECPEGIRAGRLEAELAFVIGKRCRHVCRENAREVIAGYMACNDVTARDWQCTASQIASAMSSRVQIGHPTLGFVLVQTKLSAWSAGPTPL
ncbi:fumarylacetoacetate hydrolase family protein [Phenylobacterium montanum]|uniref:fumarylacetoacetate hydrolase family protein n=1 Tax=Phenylobacterium montanum TaxID=2823693 RepID=UPI0034614433